MRTPEVYLSVGRNRRKLNGGNYYLKDGTEFELEIFNPTQDQIGCEISLDGKQISSSKLVLKPGQRVFLERFLDDNQRFKFSTYEVENSQDARQAIERNGNVTVRFFRESKPSIWWTFSGSGISGPIWPMGPIGTNGVSNAYWTNCCNFSSELGNSLTAACPPTHAASTLKSASIETGRTEKGSHSSQRLSYVGLELEPLSFYTHTLKILPESQIPADEIRQYCPECRCRVRKSSWKWCPQCGEKL